MPSLDALLFASRYFCYHATFVISDEESEEDESAGEEMVEIEDASSDEDSGDSDEEQIPRPRSKKSKSPSKPPLRRRTLITSKSQGGSKAKASAKAPSARGKSTAAWKSLAKNVLEENETPENSVLAALMQVGGTGTAKSKVRNVKLEELTRKLIR